MAHAHLENLYMAFSYNDDNYRKMSFILECSYHYLLRVVLFHVSAIKCF